METLIAIIATIAGIISGSITIASKIYSSHQKYHQEKSNNDGDARIEKVLIVSPSGRRLLLKDATIEQIKEILEEPENTHDQEELENTHDQEEL